MISEETLRLIQTGTFVPTPGVNNYELREGLDELIAFYRRWSVQRLATSAPVALHALEEKATALIGAWDQCEVIGHPIECASWSYDDAGNKNTCDCGVQRIEDAIDLIAQQIGHDDEPGISKAIEATLGNPDGAEAGDKPTPKRNGEPNPDCPRCHGTGAYVYVPSDSPIGFSVDCHCAAPPQVKQGKPPGPGERCRKDCAAEIAADGICRVCSRPVDISKTDIKPADDPGALRMAGRAMATDLEEFAQWGLFEVPKSVRAWREVDPP